MQLTKDTQITVMHVHGLLMGKNGWMTRYQKGKWDQVHECTLWVKSQGSFLQLICPVIPTGEALSAVQ